MTKESASERRLREFNSACETAQPDRLQEIVAKALTDTQNRVVAKAATVCSDQLFYSLENELKAAYERMCVTPAKRDSQCLAKNAIVRALVTLDLQDYGFFLAAMGYRQLEPRWGGAVDTATDIRVSSAMGLVGTSYDGATVALADLLVDEEPYVRCGAVRALACVQRERAEPLLRFKARTGDAEAEVLGDCFSSLLQIAEDEAVEFVSQFLDADEPGVDAYAALALGESRESAALQPLLQAFDAPYVDPEFRRVLIRAVVLHRSEDSINWLLGVVHDRDQAACRWVIEELAVFRSASRLRDRMIEAIESRADTTLSQVFQRYWAAAPS